MTENHQKGLRSGSLVSRGLRTAVVLAISAGLATSMAPMASAASLFRSHADANLVEGSALGTSLGKLGEVRADNSGTQASASSGDAAGIAIPGPAGEILTIQGLGRFAEARLDGSSDAYAGGVTAEGTPGATSASFNLKPSTVGLPDVLTAKFSVGTLSAEAHQAVDGTQTSSAKVADVGVLVAGSSVDALRAPLQAFESAYNALAGLVPGLAPFTNPVTADGVRISQDEFLNALGVSSWEQVPPNTDLVKLLPQLLTNKITNAINDVLDPAKAAVGNLPFPINVAARAALATLQAAATTVVDLAGSSFGNAASILGSFIVKPTATSTDGALTQSAIHVAAFPGLAGGAIALEVANATVGPNKVIPVEPTPVVSPVGLGVGITAMVAIALVMIRRRQIVAAPTNN